MKKISLLFLGLSMAILSCSKSAGDTKTGGQPSGRIVYVNTDTLLNNYEYYKDVVKEFDNKRFALENDLAKRSQSFQNEVALFQRRAQAGGMTEEQAKTTQLALQQKEQDIMLFRDNAAGNLQEEQAKKTDALLSNIHDYLKKYNSSDKYDMVIGYSKGGGVLYAKEDLDITQDVLKGLNEEYKSSSKKPAAVDSTAKK
ncbi:OmpH family outer membrane protein [Lacihabitans sp. LS3-19]|uniref:OmpH family outer membrane protein n=1 Tax=Lacihabitans sp. LS3-19 TaxID=2487335 RepID=UPI0020CF7C46|nr:OmpH family outer membrane protein [Lacihabitans sp. LS3-19]MCP9769526.1 OmpH family outer membrane protein [Lacihabitans sp. LS3-19]